MQDPHRRLVGICTWVPRVHRILLRNMLLFPVTMKFTLSR